jgi:hypothetical protein
MRASAVAGEEIEVAGPGLVGRDVLARIVLVVGVSGDEHANSAQAQVN